MFEIFGFVVSKPRRTCFGIVQPASLYTASDQKCVRVIIFVFVLPTWVYRTE